MACGLGSGSMSRRGEGGRSVVKIISTNSQSWVDWFSTLKLNWGFGIIGQGALGKREKKLKIIK